MVFRGQPIELRRRAYSRRIRIQVHPSGRVILSAGRGTSTRVIEHFLAEAWSWIEKGQARAATTRDQFPPKRFFAGEIFLFRGHELRLKFIPALGQRAGVHSSHDQLLVEVPQRLWPSFAPTEFHPEWRETIRRFYAAEGRRILSERVALFSALMGVRPTGLSFRCQRRRWGSCSPRGRLSLNWRLIAAPSEVLDYVVIHELAHLTHPNHSEIFWRRVAEFCPDYPGHNRWLKQNHLLMDFLGARSELHEAD